MERDAYRILDGLRDWEPGLTPGQWDQLVALIRAVGGALPPKRKAG